MVPLRYGLKWALERNSNCYYHGSRTERPTPQNPCLPFRDSLPACWSHKDGKEEEIWKRSIENIALAVPMAAQLGVQIVLENVWNHFLYDHAGDNTQNAAKYVKYVDELNSPWVGMQFDIGNHWKYGSMGDWMRQLGKRVFKLDIKGYNRAADKWARISEGDIDYADVRKALKEINFYGWCAAEVGGGDAAELKRIASEMDFVFGLV